MNSRKHSEKVITSLSCSTTIKGFCCTVLAHPRGYRRFPRYPRLRGEGHCPHCLCSPCAIILPPDFLIGSCDAHPANAEKRHDLYRKFWRLLNDLGVWRDPEYLIHTYIHTYIQTISEMRRGISCLTLRRSAIMSDSGPARKCQLPWVVQHANLSFHSINDVKVENI